MKGLTPKQINNVEKIVSDQISKALTVHSKVVPLDDAMRIKALRAVFGETYPDPVRVVSVGVSVDTLIKDPNNEAWMDYSVELCGGTHLGNSADMVAFALVEEKAISQGVRIASSA